MVIGQKNFFKLAREIIQSGFDTLNSGHVLIKGEYYINLNVGVIFKKPTGWYFYSRKDIEKTVEETKLSIDRKKYINYLKSLGILTLSDDINIPLEHCVPEEPDQIEQEIWEEELDLEGKEGPVVIAKYEQEDNRIAPSIQIEMSDSFIPYPVFEYEYRSLLPKFNAVLKDFKINVFPQIIRICDREAVLTKVTYTAGHKRLPPVKIDTSIYTLYQHKYRVSIFMSDYHETNVTAESEFEQFNHDILFDDILILEEGAKVL
jgi:hypothetical protein